jgi:hypothetical protein
MILYLALKPFEGLGLDSALLNTDAFLLTSPHLVPFSLVRSRTDSPMRNHNQPSL